MSDCLFCKVLTGDIPSTCLYQNEEVYVFLDIHPVNPGHALIIPKNHSADIREASDEDATALALAIKKIGPKIAKAMGAESFNVIYNAGRASGQMVYHTHAHIIPRFPADGHEHWKGSDDHTEFEEVAEKIREQLS